jgi:hypothetical protein
MEVGMQHSGLVKRSVVIIAGAFLLSSHAGAAIAGTVLARGYAIGGGLTSLIATRIDNHRAVIGKFEQDGQVVYFETRRGKRIRHRELGDPKYELDVCFKNAAGEPLMAQFGGDATLIAGCDPAGDVESLDTSPRSARSVDDIRGDFLTASKAIAALQSVQFKRAYATEYAALVGHALIADEGVTGKQLHPDTIEVDDGDTADDAAEEAGDGSRTHCCAGRFHHYIEVYSAPVALTFGHARHAATVAYRMLYGTGYFRMAWHRCNHGRCFWELRGNYWCSMWNPHADRPWHVHNQPCDTFYNPFSTLGGHNCNDDMVLEYASVRDNTHYSGFSGTCSDPARRDYTPPCW